MTPATEAPDVPPENVATPAGPGITCVLWMGAFFATVWGMQVLLGLRRRVAEGDEAEPPG